eukprot:6173309-Pleurochrysis_carterae.AAC.3
MDVEASAAGGRRGFERGLTGRYTPHVEAFFSHEWQQEARTVGRERRHNRNATDVAQGEINLGTVAVASAQRQVADGRAHLRTPIDSGDAVRARPNVSLLPHTLPFGGRASRACTL